MVEIKNQLGKVYDFYDIIVYVCSGSMAFIAISAVLIISMPLESQQFLDAVSGHSIAITFIAILCLLPLGVILSSIGDALIRTIRHVPRILKLPIAIAHKWLSRSSLQNESVTLPLRKNIRGWLLKKSSVRKFGGWSQAHVLRDSPAKNRKQRSVNESLAQITKAHLCSMGMALQGLYDGAFSQLVPALAHASPNGYIHRKRNAVNRCMVSIVGLLLVFSIASLSMGFVFVAAVLFVLSIFMASWTIRHQSEMFRIACETVLIDDYMIKYTSLVGRVDVSDSSQS